ncbi:MAG: hypothetical protein ACTSW4_00425 [Candidatus Ranarchaeia archaeon]
MAKCSRCGRLLGEAGMLSPDGSRAVLCGRCFRLELAINLMDKSNQLEKKQEHAFPFNAKDKTAHKKLHVIRTLKNT